MTPIDAALALLAFFFLVMYLAERGRRKKSAHRLAVLDAEAKKAASAPEVLELRIDRFDLLWFVSLTFSRAVKTIDKVAAGVPHCRHCVAALKLVGKEWVCPQCHDRRAESVADVMVIDSVSKEAVKQFLERRGDYRLKQG